jgi:hypothetical protein
MKVAQTFGAGLAFLNARVPPGTIEYDLVPATLEAPARLCLSSLRDGVFFNLHPAPKVFRGRATFAVSLPESSQNRLPHSRNKPYVDADGRSPDTVSIAFRHGTLV